MNLKNLVAACTLAASAGLAHAQLPISMGSLGSPSMGAGALPLDALSGSGLPVDPPLARFVDGRESVDEFLKSQNYRSVNAAAAKEEAAEEAAEWPTGTPTGTPSRRKSAAPRPRLRAAAAITKPFHCSAPCTCGLACRSVPPWKAIALSYLRSDQIRIRVDGQLLATGLRTRAPPQGQQQCPSRGGLSPDLN